MPDSAPLSRGVTPIGSLVELHVQLLKLASLISTPMREGVAEPSGVTLDEIKIIMCLGGEGAMAGRDLTDVMGIPPMNVSRALQDLTARQWIERVENVGDKRRKPVQLSEAGWTAYRKMTPRLADVAGYLLGDLTANERASLGKSLQKIIARMESWAER